MFLFELAFAPQSTDMSLVVESFRDAWFASHSLTRICISSETSERSAHLGPGSSPRWDAATACRHSQIALSMRVRAAVARRAVGVRVNTLVTRWWTPESKIQRSS